MSYNAEKTKLTEQQWHTVRSPEFKAWFGDWENDPHNASKAVDENGEPLVFYHGSQTREPFSEFWCWELGKIRPVYFSNSRSIAKSFARNAGLIFPVFLNVRNARIIECKSKTYRELAGVLPVVVFFKYTNSSKWHKNYFENEQLANNFATVIKHECSQVYVDADVEIELLAIPTLSNHLDFLYDGIIYKNVYDIGYGMREEDIKPSTVITTTTPQNIKSAINNENFCKSNKNIYK